MAGKSPDIYWKTADYKMSGQLKELESEHAELLKTFDEHLADVRSQLAQKKTIPAERVNQCFFGTCYFETINSKKTADVTIRTKVF